MLSKIFLVDTSCLIVLKNAGGLHLLPQTLGMVHTTQQVFDEWREEHPDWLHLVTFEDEKLYLDFRKTLGKGESSVLAYAVTHPEHTLLILDEQKARKKAKQRQLHFIGTIGVLLRAKSLGIIERLQPWIERCQQQGFYLAPALVDNVLKQVGER